MARRFASHVLIAFVPAVILDLALGKLAQDYLFSAVPVASTFIVGGVVILFVERRQRSTGRARVVSVDKMGSLDAFKVGLLQCLALVPGTSRSGATIIGAMALGLSRQCTTEFSFYLGIPTLMGAGAYSVWKERGALQAADLPMFGVGLLLDFVSALLCIRWLIRYVATHDFRGFVWYRIGFGVLLLLTAYSGVV